MIGMETAVQFPLTWTHCSVPILHPPPLSSFHDLSVPAALVLLVYRTQGPDSRRPSIPVRLAALHGRCMAATGAGGGGWALGMGVGLLRVRDGFWVDLLLEGGPTVALEVHGPHARKVQPSHLHPAAGQARGMVSLVDPVSTPGSASHSEFSAPPSPLTPIFFISPWERCAARGGGRSTLLKRRSGAGWLASGDGVALGMEGGHSARRAGGSSGLPQRTEGSGPCS
jgi:hypothetical protein